jgi:hypothetical protein
VIRGENIWLRVDPAEDTEVLAYLQRGDPIRVTGDAVAADGDAFYPIEVVETGETGWVRDLAVDPRSFTSVATLPEVVVDERPAVEVTAEPERGSNRQGRANSDSTSRVSLRGVGLDVTESFTLESGRYRVTASIQPSEQDNFIVQLVGPRDFTEYLFNEIIDSGMTWDGETTVSIPTTGDYAVEVDAPQDRWTVLIEPI